MGAFFSGLKRFGTAMMPPPANPYAVRTPPFLPSDSAPDETGDYSAPMPPPAPVTGRAEASSATLPGRLIGGRRP